MSVQKAKEMAENGIDIPWWNVDLGDEAAGAVAEAVRARSVSMGRLAAEFEQRMARTLGVEHVVAVTSGTAALMVALIEAGVGPGDEVVVPDATWIATANAAAMLGARVVLADIEKDRPLMDAGLFTNAITPRTKAVVPVHLNGRMCDMAAIMKIAKEKGIAVVEDATQSLFSKNSRGEYAGTIGRTGCFSLSVPKLITSGQGGFVVTRDAEIARRLRLIRIQGTDSVMTANWEMLGGNFRFTDLHAAIALTQLAKAQARIDGLRRAQRFYHENIPSGKWFRLEKRMEAKDDIPLYCEAYSPRRDSLAAYLNAAGIQARAMYAPLHTAPQFPGQTGEYPNATAFATETLWLPGGPDRTDDELARVAAAVKEWIGAQTE